MRFFGGWDFENADAETRSSPVTSSRKGLLIGAPEMITVWKDPDFDAKQRAFYYVRVMEIPTPRWTAYDAKRFGTKPKPDTKMTVTERAYTSPIWYSPTP